MAGGRGGSRGTAEGLLGHVHEVHRLTGQQQGRERARESLSAGAGAGDGKAHAAAAQAAAAEQVWRWWAGAAAGKPPRLYCYTLRGPPAARALFLR